jgi:hypothetical protein
VNRASLGLAKLAAACMNLRQPCSCGCSRQGSGAAAARKQKHPSPSIHQSANCIHVTGSLFHTCPCAWRCSGSDQPWSAWPTSQRAHLNRRVAALARAARPLRALRLPHLQRRHHIRACMSAKDSPTSATASNATCSHTHAAGVIQLGGVPHLGGDLSRPAAQTGSRALMLLTRGAQGAGRGG